MAAAMSQRDVVGDLLRRGAQDVVDDGVPTDGQPDATLFAHGHCPQPPWRHLVQRRRLPNLPYF